MFKSLAKNWRRFVSAKLINRVDVKGRHFTFSFKIYEHDEGERTLRFAYTTAADTNSFSMQPDELDRFVEAAQEARVQLGG
ncbi:hypothetical protein [Mesorhizobium dulcispinae]|uniref:hypothetical protein n=1 Tax=Mesorhizobium dulcispinae TaxID=3072316 RepID=UPI002A24348B|nr:hypothetical protein [Mesorhizobium sp. VK23D]MDX8521614.1 hypothetical protein [Mesorhizobium sp. VK23D]